jgi:hypothetical protein
MDSDPDNDNDAADEGNEVEFPVPAGYEPPAASRKGEEFTVIASFREEDDGMLVITKIEGTPVSSVKPKEKRPSTSPQVMSALQGGATSASQGMPAAASY